MELYFFIAAKLGLKFEGVTQGPKYGIVGFQPLKGHAAGASFYLKDSTEITLQSVRTEMNEIETAFTPSN